MTATYESKKNNKENGKLNVTKLRLTCYYQLHVQGVGRQQQHTKNVLKNNLEKYAVCIPSYSIVNMSVFRYGSMELVIVDLIWKASSYSCDNKACVITFKENVFPSYYTFHLNRSVDQAQNTIGSQKLWTLVVVTRMFDFFIYSDRQINL